MREDYENITWSESESRVDYGTLFNHKINVLKIAYKNFDKRNKSWQQFLKQGDYLDYAIFMSLKRMHDYKPFCEWGNYSRYNQTLINEFEKQNQDEIKFWQFTQFMFLKQWKDVKNFANENGIEIMGDMPIYVAYDSVETWKHGEDLFLLDENKNPALVAGVPPDAFSDEGQLWGNPIYNWEKMKKDGYAWWKKRIAYAFELFDIVRIDHFRGFDRFYAIPNGSTTAKVGEWMQGPSAELFENMKNLNVVAEDLGIIDDGVRDMLKKTGYPGMKILQFAFDGNPYNEYKPTHYTENCVAYTGTHDNQPFKAYVEQLEGYRYDNFYRELKTECERAGITYNAENGEQVCNTLIELLLNSRAFLAIAPMQDILALGDESRINFPSTLSSNNWSYRFKQDHFTQETARWLADLIQKNGRA